MTKRTDLWKTPTWLLNHFRHQFDPCPTNPTFDGLLIDWKSPSYVNPPYSNPLQWILKAIEQQKKGIDVTLLMRVDPSTKWYKLLMENKAHIAFFNERLRFNDVKGASNFSSMLVFLEGKV